MKAVLALPFIVDVVGSVQEESPVSKVVKLIQDLTAKVEADGKAELKLYDKLAR